MYIPEPLYYIGQLVYYVSHETRSIYTTCQTCKGIGEIKLQGSTKQIVCPICRKQRFVNYKSQVFVEVKKDWFIKEVIVKEIQIVLLDNKAEKYSNNYVRYNVDLPSLISEKMLYKSKKIAEYRLKLKQKSNKQEIQYV